MSSKPDHDTKQGIKIKRSLKSSCERGAPHRSQVNKKIKYSLDLNQKLLNVLCEVDGNLISKLHNFKNKSDLYQYLQKLDQDLNNLLVKPDKESKKQEIIKELHNYNELKDATQSVIGVISSITGESVTELHKQFEVYDTE